jgi:hypothetical protein
MTVCGWCSLLGALGEGAYSGWPQAGVLAVHGGAGGGVGPLCSAQLQELLRRGGAEGGILPFRQSTVHLATMGGQASQSFTSAYEYYRFDLQTDCVQVNWVTCGVLQGCEDTHARYAVSGAMSYPPQLPEPDGEAQRGVRHAAPLVVADVEQPALQGRHATLSK